jgi:hypothetical protein
MASEPWKEGWHKLRLKDMVVEATKAKDSLNFMPVFEDPETGKELSKYAYLMNNKNEAMFGANLVPLVTAILNRPLESGEEIDPVNFKGSILWVEIKKEPYQGRMTDKIVGFANKDNVPF